MEAAALLLLLALAVGGHSQQIRLTDRSVISALFDRPREPIINDIGNIHFNVPSEFLPRIYRNVTLENRFAGSPTVTVPANAKLPDLSSLHELDRNEPFSLFIPKHRKLATRLINILVGLRTTEDFVTTVIYARSRLNPMLVSYAYSVAVLNRRDTQNQALPNFACIYPDRFIGARGLSARIREQTDVPISQEQRARTPIEIPRDFTGTDLDIEHRLAYFREDIGMNLLHYNWRLLYVFSANSEVVNKDRRGELFYYFHQQIVARYNFERLSNKMRLVERLKNWREPIPEGYFPKLDNMLSSRVWPSRQANSRLSDLARPVEQIYLDVDDLERWRLRIFQAIHDGRVQNVNGSFVALNERTGIDLLGNIVESNDLSINQNLYGNLHNSGHLFMAFIHDPDNRNLEPIGLLGESAVAMRDPLFYRWHAFLDDLFQEHKALLPSYTSQHLSYPNIAIRSVEIESTGQQQPNVLITHWQKSDIDLSRGLDFFPREPVFVRITHLQHTPFIYKIKVQNTGREQMGTVRIFLAPRFDDRGLSIRLNQQRKLFIELDRFVVNLRTGVNTFVRNSNESSVTLPYERTFRDLDRDRPPAGTIEEDQFNYCGCGWPQHLLIPRGSPEGMPADLFVMVSNYAGDRINEQSTNVCRDASSYCGIRGEKYPDARAMGFPFDRNPPENVETLESFLRLGNGNMFTVGVNIYHTTRVT